MALTRSAKRLVACTASVLLLWCQGAAAAQVCVPAAEPAGEIALIAPCHDAAHPSGDAPGQVQSHGCSAQYASAGTVKIDAPQAIDLPALEIEPRQFPVPSHDLWIAAGPPARATPPPLTILHCCLRN
jgi:hypothetical protein